MKPIDREPIHCTQDGCIDTGCQVVLMSDGETAIVVNVGVSQDDIAVAGLAEIAAAHPGKGFLKCNIDQLAEAVGAIISRRKKAAA